MGGAPPTTTSSTTTTTTTTTTTPPSTGCLTATVTRTSVWSSGYGADVVLTNGCPTATTSWAVEFDLPSGTTITSSWNAVRTTTGQHHRFTNATFNGAVKPGATAKFGFNASGTGLPTTCTVDGVACDGGGSGGGGGGGGATVDVSTAAQLQAALATASPGQTIRLAAGTYRGSFAVDGRAGTAAQRITLSGPSTAVIINDGPSGEAPSCPVPTAGWDSGYGLWLFDSPYWNLTGFTVRESKKGIVLDNSHHTTIDAVSVHHVDEEAVHFRRSSADGVLRGSTITDTGLVQPGYGEGVYLGSANSNWACHGNTGGVDRSDRIQVLDNRIGPNVAAESIDVKEGTHEGVIRGNTFDGQGVTGQNSADSWIDVKGVGYRIEANTGTFRAPGVFANGYETHNTSTTPAFPNGCGNVWRDNRSDLGGVGQYAINISSVSKCAAMPNVVHASNTASGAVKGLTNIAVTP
ncbi:cellulose binding domain-containing protein [Umezawaea endophytica]|uniref:cellulose binding domain-containing protein n=1 Tax=Umezawaea endophytica TaxID=1654476 RepID=UPI00355721E8